LIEGGKGGEVNQSPTPFAVSAFLAKFVVSPARPLVVR